MPYLTSLIHRLTLLTRQLGDGPRLVEARCRAARALCEVGDPGSVQALIGALADRGGQPFGFDMDGLNLVRDHAARALGAIGEPAVEPLIAVLAGSDGWIRTGAVRALGLIADPRADGALAAALQDDEQHVRREALEALSNLHTETAIQALVDALATENVPERRAAIAALASTGNRRAVAPLVRLLTEDRDSNVRMDVARELYRFPRSEVEEPLARTLNDEDEHVRGGALQSLSYLRAFDRVAMALSDPRASIVETAALLLQDAEWEPRDATTRAGFLVATRRWDEAVAEGPAAVNALITALNSFTDDWVQTHVAAAWALGEIGDARAIEPLVEALEMDDVHIRRAVVAALVRLGDGVIQPLAAELGDTAERRAIVAAAVAPGAESAAIDRLAREIRQRWPME